MTIPTHHTTNPTSKEDNTMLCAALTKANTPCKKGIKTGHSVHTGGYVYYLCGTSHKADGYPKLNLFRRTKINPVAETTNQEGNTMHHNIKAQVNIEQPELEEFLGNEICVHNTNKFFCDSCYEEPCDCGCHMPGVERYQDEEGVYCCTTEDCNRMQLDNFQMMRDRVKAANDRAQAKQTPKFLEVNIRPVVRIDRNIVVLPEIERFIGTKEDLKAKVQADLAKNRHLKGYAAVWAEENTVILITPNKSVTTDQKVVQAKLTGKKGK